MDGSTHLILIRHSETDWNTEWRFQGHSDTPLNECGLSAIAGVVEALRPWEPAAVYTSDLQRARRMAEAAGGEFGVAVVSMEDLRECNYGRWEGKTLEEVHAEHADELEAWRKDEEGYARGGGESLLQMQERSWAALTSIAGAHPDRAVAVFTHSGPIRGAVCRIFDLGMIERNRFQVDNGSITVLRLLPSGQWRLVLLNQTNHLNRAPGRSSPVASSKDNAGSGGIY